MATKAKKPAQRGFVNNIILESLQNGDKYGYEIIKEVEEKTNGKVVLKQPSLYSSLKRFEAKGFITSYWGDSDIGGRRHYYSITQNGKEYYESPTTLSKSKYEKVITKNSTSNDEDFNVVENNEDELDEMSINENITVFEMLDNEVNVSNDDNSIDVELDAPVINHENNDSLITSDKQVNSDDPDYDIFEILESKHIDEDAEIETVSQIISKTKNSENGIQSEMFSNTIEDEDNHPIEIENESEVNLTLIEETKSNEEVSEHENSDTFEKKEIPLIKEKQQEYFSFEDKKRQLTNTISTDTTNEIEHSLTESELIENVEINNTEETTKQPEVVSSKKIDIIVDEYGILKSSEDSSPKKQPSKIDNVVSRIKYVDPISKPKQKNFDNSLNAKVDNDLTSEKTNTTFEEVEKPYEEKEKSLTEKLSKAVDNHKKQKVSEIDFKGLLGDLLIDENNEEDVNEFFEYNETVSGEDLPIDDDYVAAKKFKNTSYTTLEESLKQEGFKFKPYQMKINETNNKKNNFILVNKIKFSFATIMFILATITLVALPIVLNAQNYSFKSVDFLITGIIFGMFTLAYILMTVPYFINPKKRKLNKFTLYNNLLLCIVIGLATAIFTYAINSFYGLSITNIKDYLVTLIAPSIVGFNIAFAPIVYHVLSENNKFY